MGGAVKYSANISTLACFSIFQIMPLFSEVGSESPASGSGGGVVRLLVNAELRRNKGWGGDKALGPQPDWEQRPPGTVAGHSSLLRFHVGNTWPRAKMRPPAVANPGATRVVVHPRLEPEGPHGTARQQRHSPSAGSGIGCPFHDNPVSEFLATLDLAILFLRIDSLS